jgi:HlyD family secretion protein
MNETSSPIISELAQPSESQKVEQLLGASSLRPWWRHPGILVGVALILLIAVLLFRGVGSKDAGAFAAEAVRRGDLIVTVSATGNLEPTNEVEVGSELSGLVTTIDADNNALVRRGQPLAQLDTSRLRDSVVQGQAALAAAEAQVATAVATATQARANLGRQEEVRRLSGGQVPSEVELDTARAEYQRAQAAIRSAQAQVAQARAALSSARTNLTKATIRSPVSGVVLSRNVSPGQTVAASFQAPVLFTIAEDLSRMKLEVKVDEADVGQVKEGQTATFTVDAFPGRRFAANLVRVDVGANASGAGAATSAAAGNVVSYTAVLSLDNPGRILRPGMTATADILIARKRDALLVPNAALRFSPDGAASNERTGVAALVPMPGRGGANRDQRQVSIGRGSQQAVYVLGPDGRPQRKAVTVGETDGTFTEITGGELRPGMRVITGRLAASTGGNLTSPRGSGA